MKISKFAAVAVAFTVAAFGMTSVADAATAKREGVSATVLEGTLHYWDYITVCDTKADGNSVYSEYYRDRGGLHTISESGNGNCNDSGIDGRNLINRFNACNNLSFRPDPCTDSTYR